MSRARGNFFQRKSPKWFNVHLSSDKRTNEYNFFFRLNFFFVPLFPNLCISAAGTSLFSVVPPASCGNHQSVPCRDQGADYG